MKESIVYLNILLYIKKNGINDFNYLFKDLDNITLEKSDILEELIIFEKTCQLETLINNNIKLIEFLKSFKQSNINFLSKEFRFFIKNIELNIDKIDTYIANARKIASLGIDKISFANLNYGIFQEVSELYFDLSDIIQIYNNNNKEKVYFKSGNIIANKVIFTDGNFKLMSINNFCGKGTIENPFNSNRIGNDEVYRLNIEKASFILENENYENKTHFNHIIISDFNFNADRLPSKDELESYKEPKYVKQYKKTFN